MLTAAVDAFDRCLAVRKPATQNAHENGHGAALPIARVSESMVDVQVVALMKKVRSQAGAEHPAGTGQPIEQGGMTAWDEQLAKFENTSIGAKNRRYRPGGSSGIGTDNSNSGDQVSYQVFKPGVETSPDHLLTGCPGSNCKRADAYPCYDPQRDTRSSHGANMRQKTGLPQRRQEQRGTGPAWRPGLGLIATTSGHP
jgi:hypothetical protein